MFVVINRLYKGDPRGLKALLHDYEYLHALDTDTVQPFQDRNVSNWGVWVFDPKDKKYLCMNIQEDGYYMDEELIDLWDDSDVPVYGSDRQEFLDNLPEYPPIAFNIEDVENFLKGTNKPCNSTVRRF